MREGDTAEGMAKDFCIQHNLDKKMYDQLILLLRAQMDGLLEKIDEVDSHQNSTIQHSQGLSG